MMGFKCILLVALFAVAIARPDSGYNRYQAPSEETVEEESRSYEHSWNVQDGSDELDFGQSETKSGGKVEGYYYVLLPDTRRQKVTYYVDGDSGLIADVTYSGEAKFDSSEESAEYGRYN